MQQITVVFVLRFPLDTAPIPPPLLWCIPFVQACFVDVINILIYKYIIAVNRLSSFYLFIYYHTFKSANRLSVLTARIKAITVLIKLLKSDLTFKFFTGK